MADRDSDDRKPMLVEQTAKKYKAIRAVGILILLASAAIGVMTADEFGAGEGWGTALTAIGCGVGILVFGTGVVLSWWHHG